ncbi:MAG: hypothetical protein MRJ96_05605 [Nitrospirales bacterium]|nr:hypothetical protein [Nitrospira sp.]MDR4500909.1 hypothetical protein [Nitrospirales bacterium]
MSLSLIVLIRKDPTVSQQPVEGLRIALGLSTGPNRLTIILMGNARMLVTDELSPAIMDLDTLEKYLPSIQDLQLPIVLPEGSEQSFDLDPDFSLQKKSKRDIQTLLHEADRVVVF